MVDLDYVKKNVKKGWKLNPEKKVVNSIIKGINRCDGECPCANDAEDKHCPCSNYRLHDKCCCSLYVKAPKPKYKIASHDTFTYLPVKHWWMNLIKWTAKCQSKSVDKQIETASMIDVRVRLDKKSMRLYFAHGIIAYKGDVLNTLSMLSVMAKARRKKIYCRIMLEEKNPDNATIKYFSDFCNLLQNMSNIIPFGGMNRYDWSKVYYKFKLEGTLSDRIDEQVSSVRGIGIFPYLWAKHHNKEILEKGTDKEFLMIDFV